MLHQQSIHVHEGVLEGCLEDTGLSVGGGVKGGGTEDDGVCTRIVAAAVSVRHERAVTHEGGAFSRYLEREERCAAALGVISGSGSLTF